MRKLALFSAGFTVSAVMIVYFFHNISVLWVAGVALILSPICLKLGLGRSCAVLLGLSAGILWCFAYGTLWLAPAERAYGTEQVLSMEVTQTPQLTDYGAKVEVEISLEGRTYRALFYGTETLMEAKPGDRVTCPVEIEPSLSEEDSWYGHRAKGIILLLYGNGEAELQRGTPSWPMALRMWIQNRIRTLYPENCVPLLLALLTGDQRELSYAQRNALSVTGLSHAVAVSGLHVSVLLSAIVLLCGHNPRLTAVLGIPLSIAFVLMTGASPSACRSAVMQILMITAPLVRRETDPWTSLFAAAFLLLLENPWNIASISFQLSFGAVAGLILFSGPLQRRLLGERPGYIRRVIASGVSACLSATVTTMPLTVYYFGIFSLCAVLTNLLALWAMNAMLMLGLVSCILGFLSFPVMLLAGYVLRVVETFARFPLSAVYEENLPLMIWAVLAYILAVFLLLQKKKTPWLVAGMAVAFLLCLSYGKWDYGHDAPVYRVLDVGQGQCILLETGEVTVMVDCGGKDPEEAGEQAVRMLHSGGKSRVDVLVLTHYDEDHAGGVEQLLHRIPVGAILLPDIRDGSGTRQSIEETAAEKKTKVMAVSQLTEVTFPDGKLTVFPPLDPVDDNNGGICVLATASECDMLITGDIDQLTEMRMLSHWQLPEVEILAAGHHGAGTSTGQALLETVRPKVVTISVGKDNSYGHPDPETLERINMIGAEIHRTDKEGTIVIRRE